MEWLLSGLHVSLGQGAQVLPGTTLYSPAPHRVGVVVVIVAVVVVVPVKVVVVLEVVVTEVVVVVAVVVVAVTVVVVVSGHWPSPGGQHLLSM